MGIKDTLKSAKSKVSGALKKNKERILAGTLASGLLFGGLFVQNKLMEKEFEELKSSNAVVLVEDTNQNQQIAILKAQVESLKSLPNANASKLDKVEGLINKLAESGVDEEEFNACIDALKGQIANLTNKIVDNSVKDETSYAESIEVAIDQLKQDLQFGIRTDYKAMFIEAEKLDVTLTKQFKDGNITEKMYSGLKGSINEFQALAVRFIYSLGLDKVEEKTGYSKVKYLSSNENCKVFGSAYLDKDGRLLVDNKYTTEGKTEEFLGISEGIKQIYSENGEVDEGTVVPYIYDLENAIDPFVIGNHNDHDYNIKDGFIIEGEKGQVFIKIDKDGAVSSVETNIFYSNQSSEGGLTETGFSVDKVEYESITQEEFEKNYNEAQKKLEQLKANQQESQ